MWNKLADPGHPLWAIIRLCVMMVALVLILWMNAQSFDQTELKTIISVFMVAAGVEGVTQFFKGKQ